MSINPIPRSFVFGNIVNHLQTSLLTNEEETLGLWVMRVFQLEKIPENIKERYQNYKEFKEYLESKGYYKPEKRFLDLIFHLISNGKFEQFRNTIKGIRNELQTIETNMVFNESQGLIFLKSKVSAQQSSARMREANKLGVRVEIDPRSIPPKRDDVPDSLETICARVLLRNGYPTVFTNAEHFKNLQLKFKKT